MLKEVIHTTEYHSLSRKLLRLVEKYFRVEVTGLENIPKKGSAILLPNHSGYSGADAILLMDMVRRQTRRRARIMAHRAFFDISREVRNLAESFGLRRAGIDAGVKILKDDHLMILFPEGEAGNFKPSMRKYRLQPFHTGFLIMALKTRSPIIPCVIVGAEESHFNLGNLNFSKWIKGMRVPLPLNLIPLPAKWKIRFLPPIDLSALPEGLADDKEALHREAKRIRAKMQRTIRAELKERPFIYFPATRKIYNKAARAPLLRRTIS